MLSTDFLTQVKKSALKYTLFQYTQYISIMYLKCSIFTHYTLKNAGLFQLIFGSNMD